MSATPHPLTLNATPHPFALSLSKGFPSCWSVEKERASTSSARTVNDSGVAQLALAALLPIFPFLTFPSE